MRAQLVNEGEFPNPEDIMNRVLDNWNPDMEDQSTLIDMIVDVIIGQTPDGYQKEWWDSFESEETVERELSDLENDDLFDMIVDLLEKTPREFQIEFWESFDSPEDDEAWHEDDIGVDQSEFI